MDEMPGMIRPDLQALFPACAGVIPMKPWVTEVCSTFSRLCGGDPHVIMKMGWSNLFSPPVRG